MKDGPRSQSALRCDVAIPIHNGLSHVRPCVESVLRETRAPHRLLLMDDCSDERTAEFLRQVAAGHPHVELHRNPENLGFVRTCNRAIEESSGDYVLLLNSDTVVTPRWLDKMVRCADSDGSIAAASPLSNFCPHMRIDMLPGVTLFHMAELVEKLSDHTYPDVTTCEGFCLLLSHRAIRELGAFDEIFGMGYGEESDFCMRAVSRGWRTVCVDDTYIYHKGRGTFGHQAREELYKRNSRIFRARWGELYRRDFEDFRRRKPIDYLRRRIDDARHPAWLAFDGPPPAKANKQRMRSLVKSALKWLPRPMLAFGRAPERTISIGLTQRIPPVPKHAKAAGRALWQAPATRRRSAAARQILRSNDRLRVGFLLPTMRPYGGVISVINIANELILAGLDVRLVTMSRFKGLEHQLYTEPIYCRDRKDIPGCFPQVDIAVATQWETVDHIVAVSRLQPRAKTFYFIQDYEVNFLPEADTRNRARVIETYSRISRKVVKTEHLREQIVQHDPVCFKISPGMDLDAFYPRTCPQDRHPRRVLCMARPRTPWRGFGAMCRVFSALHRKVPDIEFVLYGTDDLSGHETAMAFPYTNRGMVSHQELPALYSSAAIYCDFSLAHGFGRTGVEAMACGCACVLTKSGGVSEYAVDEWNALLRDSSDESELATAIVRLIHDPELRAYLARNGRDTVRGYSDRVAARQMLELFQRDRAGQL